MVFLNRSVLPSKYCPAPGVFGFLSCEVARIYSGKLAPLGPAQSASCACGRAVAPGRLLRAGWTAGNFIMESCLGGWVSPKCMLHRKSWKKHLISMNCFSFDELAFSSGVVVFCGKVSKCCCLQKGVMSVQI